MNQREYVTFKIGSILFGLDILLVKEINAHMNITPVYSVADYIVGMTNLRGQVITIIDLGRRLNLKSLRDRDQAAVIIVKTDDELASHQRRRILHDHSSSEKTGLLVDAIGDIAKYGDDAIHPVPANFDQVATEYIKGLAQNQNTGALQLIINLESCLAVPDPAERYK